MPRRRLRSNRESFFETLLASPWQVSVAIGVVVFVGTKWIFPALAGNNMFLKPIATAASGFAVFFAGLFFVFGFLAYIRAAAGRAALRAVDGAASRSRPATPEKHGATRSATSTAIDPEWPGGIFGEAMARQSDTAASPPPVAKPTEWSLELIRELEWKRFEDVCQQFYLKKGIRSETTPLGPDGGIDIRLYQDESGRPTSVVQCKAWGERPVGVKLVRELLGVMTHEKIEKAFFMTSSGYSDDAKRVAIANRITPIDGPMLLMMFQRLPPGPREELLAFAITGDYRTPTCPSCGIKMVKRDGNDGRPSFWGCRNYPRCQRTFRMRRSSRGVG